MTRAVQVSFIIVNFNSGQYILNCLKSIFGQVAVDDFEVIVVDNGSTDGSVADILTRYNQVRIISNSRNLGFGAANNIGARHALGEFLFFLNPDTVLLNDPVSVFLRFLSSCPPDVASCGGRLQAPGGGYSASYGHLPSVFQQFSDIGFRVLYKGYYNRHLSISPPLLSDSPFRVGYLSGADIFIKKAVFLSIGGFDERFFMYYEDTDLFFRLNRAGWKSFLIPDARIIHHGDTPLGSGGTFNYVKYAMSEKSKYQYFARNVGRHSVRWIKAFQIMSLVIHFPGPLRYHLFKTIRITIQS